MEGALEAFQVIVKEFDAFDGKNTVDFILSH